MFFHFFRDQQQFESTQQNQQQQKVRSQKEYNSQKMNPTLKQKIQSLQQKAQTLQKQGKYKQSLDVYQQVLQINKNLFGSASEQYERISIKLCELCNIISMILLQKQKFDLCLMFLKKGESFCLKDAKYTAVTYNNYACYYRKTGKLRTALMYLQSALQLEWKTDTYLNLCAVLSQLGRHSEALQNVLYSITLLQEELFGNENINQERVSVLAIAYHNMGVELQYLKRYEECISAYEKGYKFATKHLGEGNGLAENLKNVLQNAIETKQKADQKQRKPRNLQKDKILKMRSTYQERPHTGKRSVMSRKEKPQY